MTDKELFAAYKKSAPLGDIKFFIAVAKMSEGLYARVYALYLEAFNGSKLTMNRALFYRRFTALQDAWRQESL